MARWARTRHGAPCLMVSPAGANRSYVLDRGHLGAICNMLDQGETLADATATAYALADIFFV